MKVASLFKGRKGAYIVAVHLSTEGLSEAVGHTFQSKVEAKTWVKLQGLQAWNY